MPSSQESPPPPSNRNSAVLRGRRLHRHIADVLERARGRRTWTSIAAETGIPQSTLSSQVTKPKFSVETVYLLMKALEVDPREVFG